MTTAWLILLDTALLWALAFGLAWAGTRMVLAVVGRSEHVPLNYRGTPAPAVLGFVWLFWAIGEQLFVPIAAGLGDFLFNVVGLAVENASGIVPLFDRSDTFFARAAAASLAVVLVGLVDDVWGDGDTRGLRGHFAALRSGLPTTGSVKVMGIGLVALVVGAEVGKPLWGGYGVSLFRPAGLLGWLLAAGLIAGTANLLNLTDLRPGRTLKSYVFLTLVTTAVLGLTTITWPAVAPIERVLAAAVVFLYALGPVLAVWRLDLGEKAMLGDAGANAFGFVAGVLLVMALPGWGIAVAFTLVLALTLLSERVSFSAVIDGTSVLRWIDSLGRASSDEMVEKTDER